MAKRRAKKGSAPANRPSADSGRHQTLDQPKKKGQSKKTRKKPSKSPPAHEPRSKMAHKTKAKHGFQDSRDRCVQPYGASESRQRLDKKGFHPNVTDSTPQDVIKSWARWVQDMWTKPTREIYLDGGEGFNGAPRSVSRQLTRAPLIFRTDFFLKELSPRVDKNQPTYNRLANLLGTPHVGGQIIEFLFADGLGTIQSLAVTCTQVWGIVAMASNIWDFQAAKFRTQGHSGVFLVLTPEYTIKEFIQARDEVPSSLTPNHFVSTCARDAFIFDEILEDVGCLLALRSLEPEQKSSSNASTPGFRPEQRVLDLLPRLKSIEDIRKSGQFITKSKLQLFDAQPGHAFRCFKQLLTQIHEQRNGINILCFHKTPFLDRRVLAVVLRACPKVTMLGIYDCPLIHFGDIVCILDLIWEINTNRKKLCQPLIEAFDFFPRYHDGMPYEHPRAAAYGITWGSLDLEVVQRGFFLIILKAFMKSQSMKLSLLFAKNKAFIDYLKRVPTHPLAVPSFLSALYRLMDLKPGSHSYEVEYKQALYDLLKPVRLGLEKLDCDFPKWYIHKMGRYMHFCSSCGYQTFEEFFPAKERMSRPHTRRCAGCCLQTYLDRERDHLKMEIQAIITSLFPEWTGNTFNLDAPIPTKGNKLIKLRTNETVRPTPPGIQVLPDGDIHEPQYMIALVRDNKPHKDSLQELPTLGDLTDSDAHREHWQNANQQCVNLELYRRCVTLLSAEGLRGKALLSYHTNNVDEPQYINVDHMREVQSYTFRTAGEFQLGLMKKGW